MPLTPTEVNVIADAETPRLDWVSVHTATPGTTGTAEAIGGSPAYARKALVFGVSASGTATAAQVTVDVPAGTYTHFGVWTAATAGTFLGGNALLPTSQVFASQGQLLVTVSLPVTAT